MGTTVLEIWVEFPLASFRTMLGGLRRVPVW
jgi:hypothetical protein